MDNVTAQVLGGQAKTMSEVETVQDLVDAMDLGENHSVKVNGETADYNTSLSDFDFVSFGEKVKGGKAPKTILRKAKDIKARR